jgi:hypothetical protein
MLCTPATQVVNAMGNWGSHFNKIDKKTETAEQKAIDAANKALTKAQGAAKDKDNDPAVKQAQKRVDDLMAARRRRQFPLLVAAYQAATAVSRAVKVISVSWHWLWQTIGHKSQKPSCVGLITLKTQSAGPRQVGPPYTECLSEQPQQFAAAAVHVLSQPVAAVHVLLSLVVATMPTCT